MKAKITGIKEKESNYGGMFYYVFFKSDENPPKSYRTCVAPKNGNFQRWLEPLSLFNSGKEVWLDQLVLRGKGFIDADSLFTME